jgi:hypothetical protein
LYELWLESLSELRPESSSEFSSEGPVVADGDLEPEVVSEIVSEIVVDSEDEDDGDGDGDEVGVLLVLVVTAAAGEDVLSDTPVGARVYLETPFVGG